MFKGEVLGLVLSKGEVLPFCPCTVALGFAVLCCCSRFCRFAFGFRIISGRLFGLRKEGIYIIYLIKRNKSDLKIRKKMLTWKIVGAAEASVLYIYIDYRSYSK